MYGFPRPLRSLLPAALGLVLLSMQRPAGAPGAPLCGFPRPLRSLLPAALGLVLLSMQRRAAASGDYPGRIATKFDVDPPACTICHRDPNGGCGRGGRA